MKKIFFISLMLTVAFIGTAKDLKTLRVTTQPVMVCNNCENKIKKNIRFEKGVTKISTDLKEQVVTIIYDADKTDQNKIIKAFDKIKYKATVLTDDAEASADSITGTGKQSEQSLKK